MRGHKRIHRHHGKRGRAVDEDEVIVLSHRSDGVLESTVAILEIDKIDFCGRKISIRRHDVITPGFTGHRGFRQARAANHYFVDRIDRL